MMTSDIFYSPDKLIFQSRGGLHLILDPLGPNWLSTEPVGSLIIRRLDGRRTLDEIALEIARVWNIDADRASDDVRDFVRQALSHRFIARTPFLEGPYVGRDGLSCPAVLNELWVFVTNQSSSGDILCAFHETADNVPAHLAPRSTSHLAFATAELSAQRVVLTGGQPFLHPEILMVIADIIQILDLRIVTDGAFLTSELVDSFSDIDSRERLTLEVNLDGPDASTHDALRGPSFEKTVEGIKRAVRAGLGISVLTSVTSLNVSVLPEIARLASELGVTDQLFRLYCGDAHPRLIPSADRVSSAFDQLLTIAGEIDLSIGNLYPLRSRVRRGRGVKADLCTGGVSMLAVRFDGNVFPCPALIGEERFNCGNIFQTELSEIWKNSPILGEFRSNSVQKRQGCAVCGLKFICGGGCMYRGFLSQRRLTGAGSLSAHDPFCHVYRGLVNRLLWEEASRGVEIDLAGEDTYRKPVVFNAMQAPAGPVASGGAIQAAPVHCGPGPVKGAGHDAE